MAKGTDTEGRSNAPHDVERDDVEQDDVEQDDVEQNVEQDAEREVTGEPGEVGGIGAAELAGVSRLSYEQAREELVSIVTRLETGQAPLEDSMALWRRGEALAAHCATWLDSAQAEIEKATRPE